MSDWICNREVRRANGQWRAEQNRLKQQRLAKLNAEKKAKAAAKKQKRKSSRANWYSRYLRSPHWKAKRLEALEHYGNRCSVCGSRDDLQVHHKHYGSLKHEAMNDLEILCVGCHENAHEGKPGVFDPLTREYLRIHGKA